MEKRKPLCTVGGNVNWCSHYGKQYGFSSKKLKIELPYSPAIPLRVFLQRKQNQSKRNMHPIADLFTIAKIWKQPECPSIDEWIKKMWYTHTHNEILVIKKNEILPVVTT